VVQWIRGSRRQRSIGLFGSFQHSEDLKSRFTEVHFHHIYRENNQEADLLSKQACSRVLDSLVMRSRRDGDEEILPSIMIAL
jgi:predicted transcriptional regulator